MNLSRMRPLALAAAAFVYTLCGIQVAIADDTEIYVPKDLPADQQVRPNILFVLDSSGSMTATVPGSGSKNRNQVMHEVVGGLVDSLKSGANVNIGFMRYGGWTKNLYVVWTGWTYYYYSDWGSNNEHGGHVIYPITHLSSEAVAIQMKNIVNSVDTSDWTPLLETYYEAFLYLTGQAPHFSGIPTNHRNDSASIENGKFISPINHSCQKTHIIYITDGEPTRDVDANKIINDLVRNKSYTKQCEEGDDGACLSQLAAYMANEDMALQGGRNKKPFDDGDGRKQTITSHFVGFAIDKPFLQEAATAGGGQYLTSDNASGLTDALQAIVVDIAAENSTFVAPSVAVSAYNNLGFRNELYYALFRPAEGTNWPGNVKKYKLKTEDNNGDAIDPIIVDRVNNSAIDNETGFFKDSASSFWNTVIDGADIAKGGAAEKLKGRNDRKIYTWYGSDRVAGAAVGADSLKAFVDNSSLINNTMLDATSSSRTDIVKWVTENTGRMGDILHNEPRLVAYETEEDLARAKTTNSKEKLVMFVGSNEGFIHAIDPSTGVELYSFIPKELLHIPSKYLANSKGYSNKAYGMDGLMGVWTEYGDTVDNSKKAKKVNLYAGMRRGGSNYYALDVTEKANPKLKWVVKGAYNDTKEITPGFENLGLTFSAPKLADINVSGKKTKVLIFTGGYDKKHDEIGSNIPRNDTLGNSLYIVNADTGQLLWRVSGNNDLKADVKIAAMTNSMPASPTLVDYNNDGLTDIVYVADLRGQIFRFDIKNNTNENLKDAITGVQLAKLGGEDVASNRRFFNSPDVALIRDRGQEAYFTVSLGSGFRESPLNQQTDDRFYMVRDKFTSGARPNNTPPLSEADLTDVTATKKETDSAAIYTEIDKLEAKIKQLNAKLKEVQDDYEQHKKNIGYTAAYDAYLELYNKKNQLQKEIDQLSNKPYGLYDPTRAEDGTPYNAIFLEDHVTEVQAQSQLQTILVEAQKALRKLQYDPNTNDLAPYLADLYAGLLATQSATKTQSDRFVEQENFLLKGNLAPKWTPELIEATKNMYQVPFDESSGDFTDNNNLFIDYIKNTRENYKTSPEYTGRQILNQKQSSVVALLKQLTTASYVEVPDLLDELKGMLTDDAGVEPESGDIDVLLALDEAGKQQVLTDKMTNYTSTANLLAQKRLEFTAVHTQMQAALEHADNVELQKGNFKAKQDAIDAAYAAASNSQTGISAIRTAINTEYAKLEIIDGTVLSAQLESLKTSAGFYLRLPRGEKVLSNSISYRGTVLFNTFSPRGKTISVCGSDVGTGKAYALSLRDSKGMFSETINGTEYPIRSIELKRSGIPPAPAIVFTEKKAIAITGTEILDLDSGAPLTPTHWREK